MINRTILVFALSVTVATAMFLGTLQSEVHAQATPVHAHGLVGAWAVQVTLRNCATQTPLGPPFASLLTLHEGGTITETPGGQAFAPGQRTSGHGTWTRQPDGSYRLSVLAMLLFDTPPNLPGTPTYNPAMPISPGFFAGWQTLYSTFTLDDGNHGSSVATNAFYRFNGDVYRTGCSTAVSERIQ